MFKMLSIAAALAAIGVEPAFAHHSGAMFDNEKTLVLEGQVKEFQWTNPHSWLQVLVKDPQGKQVEWSLEMGSPAQITPRGIRYGVFKPGDKVTVSLHPMRDGSAGGNFMHAVMADGRTIGLRAAAPAQ